MRRPPLEDVTIIAIEQYGAGPWGSVHLADLGAARLGWTEPMSGLVAAAIAAGAVGLVTGWFLLRYRGITLIMLTLATAIMLQETGNLRSDISGGYDGLPGKSTFIDKHGNERDIPAKVTGFLCGAGEVIQLTEPNSGGYGNPLDREPRMVLEDVLDDFTTIELAREAYGVVISDGLQIDEAATETLRAQLRSERGADFQGELLTLVSTPHPLAISPYAKAK